ncbi:hypothetical protein [Nonomuraea jabiensis]|uniref:WD40 repeat domain-containing protein n=1 Tax=Nonomuraea jabiensis TaxID=882448 RepID=A0A7W9G270_9ACTN|nr:hypothetical protein [Nonomuraea jabiensis]MBB5775801.1 hypothetical protein [Nonomuraea jabiensis]
MTGIEERLRDALAARAETVRDDGRPRHLPAPRERSSGARWWAPLAVAAAILIVVAATVVVTRTVTSPAPAVRPTPDTSVAPVEQMWPGAVHEIPTKGPGGAGFMPDVFVSDRVVVGRGYPENRPLEIWSYDLDKRTFATIARLRKKDVGNHPLVFGDGHLAWAAFSGRMKEVWTVPVTGGVPRRIASDRATVTRDNMTLGISRLAIADGLVVWSPDEGGVYRAPLKGGKATLIDGTKGYSLVEWPWAGSPRNDSMVGDLSRRPVEHLKNLLTGERRDVVPPAGRTSWTDCGVTWCFNGEEAWRRDGAGLRKLPGYTHGELSMDRFVRLLQAVPGGQKWVTLYDLATGRAGLLYQIQTGLKRTPILALRDGIAWFQKGRSTQVVINLAAIGR